MIPYDHKNNTIFEEHHNPPHTKQPSPEEIASRNGRNEKIMHTIITITILTKNKSPPRAYYILFIIILYYILLFYIF